MLITRRSDRGDAGTAFSRDFVPARHVDDVDGTVHQLGTETGREVIPAAFDEDDIEVGKPLREAPNGILVERCVLAYGGVWTSARFHTDNPLFRETSGTDEELRVPLS